MSTSAMLICDVSRAGFSCERSYQFQDWQGNIVSGADQVIRFFTIDGDHIDESCEKQFRGLLQVSIIDTDESSMTARIRYWNCMDSEVARVHCSTLHVFGDK